MLTLILNPQTVAVGLAGAGEGLARRLTLLTEAGVAPVAVSPEAGEDDLEDLSILLIAGLAQAQSARLAATARSAGVLVNVEDQPSLCDFHVPAVVRRGDLLITVSTAGKAPGLAKLVRQWIERRLGLEWSERTAELAASRASWRQAGAPLADVSKRTAAFVEQQGWLP